EYGRLSIGQPSSDALFLAFRRQRISVLLQTPELQEHLLLALASILPALEIHRVSHDRFAGAHDASAGARELVHVRGQLVLRVVDRVDQTKLLQSIGVHQLAARQQLDCGAASHHLFQESYLIQSSNTHS
ncbi:hypothetical protein PENTCL1PPCAC_12593, partial [Pristionchus entomophagus]